MNAKEMFEDLGFLLKEDSEEGIQYVKESPESEMDRIGMITIEYIEFYHNFKEIALSSDYKHRDMTISSSPMNVLDIKILKAINKQIEELNW